MKRMTDFFDGLADLCCNVFALLLLLGGVSYLFTGFVGLIDCFTGGYYFSYGIAGIMITIGAVLIIILTHMP